MIRRRTALVALAIAFVAGLYALGQVAVRRLDFFRLRSVEFSGVRHLDERDLAARIAIPADAHILLPLGPIHERVLAVPGVREATVARRWPGTVIITITEAPAVALVPDDGHLLVLDDRGGILPVDPSRLTTSLPLADRDTAVAALLGRLQAADPLWFAAIDRARADGRDVVLDADGRRVRLAAGAASQLLLDLAAVREWLERSGIPWRAIDARFAGRMFVERGTA